MGYACRGDTRSARGSKLTLLDPRTVTDGYRPSRINLKSRPGRVRAVYKTVDFYCLFCFIFYFVSRRDFT